MRKWKFLFWVMWLGISSMPAFGGQETIKPGDTIHVWVKGEPELTLDKNVESDGEISFPLLGRVRVAGLSTVQAGQIISQALNDGYLRNPLVQVEVVGSKAPPRRMSPVVAEPLSYYSTPSSIQPVPNYPSSANDRKQAISLPVEVIDRRTSRPIGDAALLLGGKIYQTNRLGQMVIETDSGPAVLMANGYKVLQDDIGRILRPGSVGRILMEPIQLAPEIFVVVVDQSTGNPLSNVNVNLNSLKVKTNSKGSFRIKDLKTEFGEVYLSKQGYKSIRKILDFKDPTERTVQMIRDD